MTRSKAASIAALTFAGACVIGLILMVLVNVLSGECADRVTPIGARCMIEHRALMWSFLGVVILISALIAARQYRRIRARP